VNIYLLQNFESIDTQPSLGGRYADPIPYFDNGAATDGLHIGGACHEQGGSHDPSGLCQVQYRRGCCHLRIWAASAGRQLTVQLRHRRDSNTRLNLSLFILKYNSDGILQSPLQTLILLARSVTSFDGDKYEGEYKEGEFNGQGIFTSFDGAKYVGEFKDGNFWNGTTYEIDGNFFGKLVNGKLKVK